MNTWTETTESELYQEAEAGQFYRPRKDALKAARGVVWSVVFSLPFWLVVGLLVLKFKK